MYDRPKNLEVAAVLAGISGIVALVAAFLMFDPQADNVVLNVGVLLLISALFFGLAGGLSTNGQWKWNMTMFMIFLCATIVVAACLLSAVDLEIGILLLALVLIIAALTATKKTEAWMS